MCNRAIFILCISFLIPLISLGQTESEKPNILFLFADDQRHDTIHYLGNDEIKTPNIDKLATEGTAFTNSYIMGGTSAAVCAPSRSMLMTGRSLFHIAKQGEWTFQIDPEHKTFPEQLRDAGYETFATGKQHNGKEAFQRAFSNGSAIFFGGMDDHYNVPLYEYDSTGKYAESEKYIGDKHSSELFADAFIDFVEGRTAVKPFLAYVSFMAPHDPRIMPEKYDEIYPPGFIELPDNFLPEHPFDNGELKIRDEMLAPFPRTSGVVKEHIADYYAMITHMDAQIGRMMRALEETGELENTIVVFAGDNGLAVGQHGLLGKQNLYEHSIKVPLIFKGPGIPADSKRSANVYLTDVYPTLMELTNLEIPDTVEGISLLDVINDDLNEIRENLGFAYLDIQRAVLDDNHKLIEYYVNGYRTTQQFDIKKDPLEMNNLANDVDNQEIITKLRQKLVRWMEEHDDTATDFLRVLKRELE
ncbi:MAG: sulfatase-like hydrolase/transferase [Bacteroidetes bacterium]|nr:sulfatase-like hydrolase/transferase [Bacteroidota bacterium]